MEITKEAFIICQYLGAGIAVGLGGLGAGLSMGDTAKEACAASERQQLAKDDIFTTMLIGQAATSTSSVFALVIALLQIFVVAVPETITMGSCVAMIASGLCIGIGCMGPGLGSGYPASAACRGVGRNPRSKSTILFNMLIGQSVSQTPAIFAFLVALLLLFKDVADPSIAAAGAILGAGIAMGAGAIGPGIGTGVCAQQACQATSENPSESPVIMRTMLIGQAVSQSTAIYALVISLILMMMKA